MSDIPLREIVSTANSLLEDCHSFLTSVEEKLFGSSPEVAISNSGRDAPRPTPHIEQSAIATNGSADSLRSRLQKLSERL